MAPKEAVMAPKGAIQRQGEDWTFEACVKWWWPAGISAKSIGFDVWRDFQARADKELVTVSMRPMKRGGQYLCRVAIYGRGDLSRWICSVLVIC